MSSKYPITIKNISSEAWEMVQAISEKSGSDVAEVVRQCVVAGSLIELIKAGPTNEAGKYGEFSSAYLAGLARRVLGAPIDFLLETGQHPYLPALTAGAISPMPAPNEEETDAPASSFLLDQGMVEELQRLGVGASFSAGWQPD